MGENDFLRLLWKWIYFVEVSSQKVPLLGCSRRGFYFWKINISEILRHAHFEEIAFLLIFGQNVHPDTPRDSQEALQVLSGDSQKASPSSLEATGEPDQSWKENLTNSYVFFCRKWATDLFRRRVAKVTCTKYRACAQKLSAVFANGSKFTP